MFKLKQGNCLELMPQIPSGSVHAVISDIPYGINFCAWDVLHDNANSALLGSSPAQDKSKLFKTRGKPKNGWSEKDKNIGYEFQLFCVSFLAEVTRILKPCGYVVCFTGRQYQHRYTNAAEECGLTYMDTLAWNKVSAPFRAQRVGQVIGKRSGDYSDERRLGNLAPVFEPIVVCRKAYRIGGTVTDEYLEHDVGTFSIDHLSSNLITCSSKIENRQHDTQKPLELMEILVKTFTKVDHTILDPFMGSGTTGVAAVNTDRNFIGIEQEDKYFTIAKQRIQQAEQSLSQTP